MAGGFLLDLFLRFNAQREGGIRSLRFVHQSISRPFPDSCAVHVLRAFRSSMRLKSTRVWQECLR